MSRLRSGRGASSGRQAAGGRASGRPGVFVQTPKSDIFVAMLSIALGAIVLGCTLLIMVLSEYNFELKASFLQPTVPAATSTLLG